MDAVIDSRLSVSQGMKTSGLVRAMTGFVCLGKSDFEAIEPFRQDRFFKEALGLSKVPSSAWMQWRKGLELARGEYVWIAEADDLARPEFLDRIVRRMQENGAVLGFCDSWQIDEDGRRLGESYKPYVNQENPGAFDQSFVMDGREFLEKYLAIKNVILNVSGVVFCRDALKEAMDRIGDGLHQYKVAGDWRIYIELCAMNGKVVYEAEPLNGHRRHRTSVTHALDAQRHLREIESMHALSRARVVHDVHDLNNSPLLYTG